MWRYYGDGTWMMGNWLGMVFMGLVFVVIVIVIISLIAGAKNGSHYQMKNMSDTDSAMKILHERYAKGEINEEEYQRMKQNLKL